MNTDNTFLRYSEYDAADNEIPGSEQFLSINDLEQCGPPVNDNDCELSNDGFLYYRLNEDEFVRLERPEEE